MSCEQWFLDWVDNHTTLKTKNAEKWWDINLLEHGILDSLAFVSLIADAEEHFGIMFTDEQMEMPKMLTAKGFVEVVHSLM